VGILVRRYCNRNIDRVDYLEKYRLINITMHKHHKIIFENGKRIRTKEIMNLTVAEHANEHKRLYEVGGHWQDKLAYQGLMKLKKTPDIMREIHKYRKPESYATYGMLGKKQSEQQKRLTSKSNKKVWKSYTDEERKIRGAKVAGKKNGLYGVIPPNAIPVEYNNKKYKSIAEAERKTGKTIHYIMKEVNNGRKSLGRKIPSEAN
jgi:hypothetical protein